MITSRAWAGKRYAVLGLARSGAATVAALVASGASVVAWDADEARRTALSSPSPLRGEGRGEGQSAPSEDVALPLSRASLRSLASSGSTAPRAVEAMPGAWPTRNSPEGRGNLEVADLATLDLTRFDALILSPGVPLNTHPLAAAARAAGVPIIGDIELFAQARAELPPHKVVGITGTNGKSTTTALVTHILKTAGVPALMGGNIGVPILSQDPLHPNEHGGGVYVLELSSYQIDLTRTLDCDIAVLLNITPDHLDRYDGRFEAYAASKQRLFEMQSPDHFAVIAEDDVEADEVVYRLEHDLGRWENVARSHRGLVPDQSRWPSLQGPHNASNAHAAIEVANCLGVDAEMIEAALISFPGLPHRMERIATLGGVTWYDDSKATNPESTAPALAAFPRVHWIVGGRAKGDDLDACLPHLGHVARAYTIGEAVATFARVLAPHVAVTEAGTLDRAVASAAHEAQRGEVVLLSPAAASFDQFRDYEHRGQVFRSLVEALA